MGGAEPIGHYDYLVAKRQAITGRLPASALRQNFPTLYAQPLPREAKVVHDPSPAMKAEITELKAKNAELQHENARLQVLLAELSKPLTKRRPITILAVQEAFCLAMDAAGRVVEEQSWTIEDLKSPRRSHPYSHPRQVCMWLVRRICRLSWPITSRAFGGRDHTTAIHACKRAPEIMGTDPGLRAVAVSVLRSFGADADVDAA